MIARIQCGTVRHYTRAEIAAAVAIVGLLALWFYR